MKQAGLLSALMLTTTLNLVPWLAHANPLNLPALGDTTSGIISQQEEYELGRSWLKILRNQTPMVADPELKHYLESLTHRLSAASQLSDHRLIPLVIDSTVLNAFAAPGGIVGVNTGLFLHAETEPQFAAVLAHELAHLSQRHYARNVEEARNQSIPTAAALLGSILIMATAGGDAGAAALTSTVAGMQSAQLRFSRQFEREADNLGISTLANAGFDPQAMPAIFEQMNKASRYGSRPPEFLLTHPVTENRISDSRARADQMSARKTVTNVGSLNYQLMRMRAAYISSNNIHEMARQLSKEVTVAADNAPVASRYGLALASLKARDFNTAEQQTNWLLQHYPDNPHMVLLKVQLESETGKGTQALERINQLLSINPGSYPLQAAKAEVFLKQQNYTEARNTLLNLSRSRPEDPDIWFELAEVQGLAEDIIGLHQSRAEYFFLNGNMDDAIKHLQYAMKMAEDNFALKSKLQQKLSNIRDYRQKLKNS
ncbi:M48 family metalloprotease [Endozoicomonas ascidiicola]|uniref:M48 family metalloprotease n=1 Tax=Endozoicomonas ascidiicola TaxID=1698521 RepID=UPI000AC62D1C|nr:M48 family metalloprotease [Endozoicomonas ascidiicola]